MTDQEKFEEWWNEESKSIIKMQPDYTQTSNIAFLAALEIGREEVPMQHKYECPKCGHPLEAK